MREMVPNLVLGSVKESALNEGLAPRFSSKLTSTRPSRDSGSNMSAGSGMPSTSGLSGGSVPGVSILKLWERRKWEMG